VGKSKQQGSLLIEILITLMIMAVGLLGLASLQMISIKNINNSQFRTLATAYSYDMAERMRSNRTGVESDAYDAINGSETEPSCASCSASEVAQRDAYEWNQMINQDVIDGGLPQGVGTVTKSGQLFAITISWQEQTRDSEGGTLERVDFTLNIQI